MDFIDTAAKKKLGINDESIKTVSIEAITGGLLVYVCNTSLYKSGPRKGKIKYDTKTKRPVLLTTSDLKEVRDAYEAETKNCASCKGTGQSWCGWSEAEGNRYKPCKDCDGSGKV